MKGKFGSAYYAEEDLAADPGSAFLMVDPRIEGGGQHESYLATGLKALKNDRRCILRPSALYREPIFNL